MLTLIKILSQQGSFESTKKKKKEKRKIEYHIHNFFANTPKFMRDVNVRKIKISYQSRGQK